MLTYYDIDRDTQSAHFQGKLRHQATKWHLTVKRLKTMKNEMTYILFGWVVVFLSKINKTTTQPNRR